jgi:ribosomal protein L32
MPSNVKPSKQTEPSDLGPNHLTPQGKLPASMKPCMHCGEAIMQSNNSCSACGSYQTPNGLLRPEPRTTIRR